GATIDTAASTGHGPAIMAMQQAGESTCTLGEVRQRAGLIVFWGCDPVRTHPRFLDRFCPPRLGRTLVAVDVRDTDTTRIADGFVPVEPGRDWEAFATLRLLVAGKEPQPGSVTGASLDRLRDLADRMRTTPGIVFYGGGLLNRPLAHRTIEALFQLVTDLNQHVRFYARRLRRAGDVAGADGVLTWQTGYPFGVNLGRGFPRYNPGEFTAPDLLARGDVDACVLVGGACAADLPAAAREHLRRIPVVSLDPPGAERVVPAAVRFTTAVFGVHRPGTAQRLDEVGIPLRVLLPSALPDDGDVLAELLRRMT
ncbi:MAG: formylmethanofuran dehydrogenase subunit B, partial [Fimbriiglobus sp.]